MEGFPGSPQLDRNAPTAGGGVSHGDVPHRVTGGAPGQHWELLEGSFWSGSGSAGVEKMNLHLRDLKVVVPGGALPEKA